ncbi:polypeptide N-acetylgalactosaminyltransferase 1 isoform X2 [Bicyclus anynana]|uniref:Polypeptide N-acetylgalactosaminyltransferase 1 isoform X2 n=1 Tax=Bicyclus anynana TaxID=110368 RepID=A0ABM3LVB2_BICAN|nr:polypeptide N-acetylgalactosaminyltransferase 1 isoform X2 [Bicyclus anynana]
MGMRRTVKFIKQKMKLPVRKCYHAAKAGFFVILVVTILTLFEHWRGGKRAARAMTSGLDSEAAYEKAILEDEARIIPGLGEGGVAAHLTGEAQRLGEESEKQLAINVYLSDRIAYNRTLQDHRHPACKRVVYDAELPSASVILIFHNEPYSVVLRTVWSVVNSARRDNPWFRRANYVERGTGRTMTLGYPGQDPNSPFVYLKEIILVDDNSTLPELKGKLSHYVKTRLPPDLIRIIRLPDRRGLMLARVAGARAARGAVLLFLDAHCEAGADWLRPLLARVARKRDAVLTPLIDVLDQTSFRLDAPQHFQVGGFTFMGHFTWIDVPEREKKRRGSDIAPTWSPTMAGGLFAINRAYYWEIGAYDEQMAGWGGENLEMSFRVWQCGGTLETVPCSRVGHVFRSFHPYGLPAHSDTHGINTARMADVWMDEYAELFYLHRPDLRESPKVGDVTHRRVLREKLQCKSFQWYLDNVYPEKFVPVRDVFGYGRFVNNASGLCLDTLQRDAEASPLGVYGCHKRLEATQYLALSLRGELRDEEKCAEVQYTRTKAGDVDGDESRRVLMVTCHGKLHEQNWRYLPSGQLQHVESGLCLRTTGVSGSDATVARCRSSPLQLWTIDYSERNDFGMNGGAAPSEQDVRLRRLRGQRRVSRSLLSVDEEEGGEDARRRERHKHKNKKGKKSQKSKKHTKKNKFVLKLLRARDNASDEHLEADLYCRHRRLFPNNSFVRDLVAALNDHHIKVINNGRVFENNRVSALVKPLLALPPAGTSAPPHGMEPKRQKKRKYKKPLEPLSELVAPVALYEEDAPVAHDYDATVATPGKIIVEDFVEVTPAAVITPPQRPKKRKRVRSRRPAPPAPPAPQHYRHTSARGGRGGRADDSAEDAPLLDAPPDAAARQPAERRADGAEGAEGEGERAPVKVLMRSNLTFNLGDEFFRWHRAAADDVANLLGELVIPESMSAHAQADTHTDARTHARDGYNDISSERELHRERDEKDKDELLTGRGRSRLVSADSSASDSGDE